MRFIAASIIGLAIASSAPGVAEAHKVELKCSTVNVGGTKTRTKFLPTHTCHKTIIVRPIATVESTHTPKARTRTKVAVTVATQVVSANARTAVVTSTSTKFSVLVPTTTVTNAPFKPTSTEYEILPPTTTISSMITSYTLEAPAPTLVAPVPRGLHDDNDGDEADGDDNDGITLVPRNQLRMNYDGYPGANPGAQSGSRGVSPRALRGKQIICTPHVKVTTTVTKKAKVTVTETKRAHRPTVTITSTATGTVTSTRYLAGVTSIVTKARKLTLTANTITATVKPTDPKVTVTKTLDVHADPPTQTTVVDLYSVCDPVGQFPLRTWTPDASTPYQDPFSTGITPDAPTCCQSIAGSPGSVTWAWVQTPPDANYVTGTCYGLGLNFAYKPTNDDLESQCVAENPGTMIGIIPGDNEVGGLLQCGQSTN
ncbi:unnamed protein product [Tilletia controversa]|uniref:Uncharacterized protein n=1 Tax=Tilletia controversa TaxID=13291 RepID=A0A8X7SZR8_9BASI|nr:hypothetical protein CF328_g1534 [Tilletia controversa]KAE8252944.1 hypothetical protein A4X06_0g1815 [Tilletia controversa]CAD6957893.1 unnamed protein product [Tilletia controversa]